MARHASTLKVIPRHLDEALQLTIALQPSSPGQEIAQREMAVALESALDARRQRILVSHSSVSLLKWACIVIQAICVLIAIALSHGDERAPPRSSPWYSSPPVQPPASCSSALMTGLSLDNSRSVPIRCCRSCQRPLPHLPIEMIAGGSSRARSVVPESG